MQITYELTQKDFIEAYSAHRNRSALRKWFRRIVIWAVCLFALFVLFGFLVKPTAEMARSLIPFFALVTMWILVLVFLPRWSMTRQFTKQPGAHGPRTLQLDDTGAHWRWNGGSSDVEWRNYIQAVDSQTQFLFYTSPACFNILPKAGLTPVQLSEIRALLKKHIPTSS